MDSLKEVILWTVEELAVPVHFNIIELRDGNVTMTLEGQSQIKFNNEQSGGIIYRVLGCILLFKNDYVKQAYKYYLNQSLKPWKDSAEFQPCISITLAGHKPTEKLNNLIKNGVITPQTMLLTFMQPHPTIINKVQIDYFTLEYSKNSLGLPHSVIKRCDSIHS